MCKTLQEREQPLCEAEGRELLLSRSRVQRGNESAEARKGLSNSWAMKAPEEFEFYSKCTGNPAMEGFKQG